jgi:hypothetical protein
MAHDLDAERRLRELLADPEWELPVWADASSRVRGAARRQRLRSARRAAGATVVSAAVVLGVLAGLRLSGPPTGRADYQLPTATAGGFPVSVYPRDALAPLLQSGIRCPDPAGVQQPPAGMQAQTTAVVRRLGASFSSDLHSSDPSNWPHVQAGWRSGSAKAKAAAPVLYSGPLTSMSSVASLARTVRASCGNLIAADTWLIVTGQRGDPAQQSQYLLLDRAGHVLVWHTA